MTKKIILFAITLFLLCSIFSGCIDESEDKYDGPPEIITLSFSPNDASKEDKITIDAIVKNTSSMRVDVETMYITGHSIADLNAVMEKINDKHFIYSFTAPSAENLIWCVARAQNQNGISVKDILISVGNMSTTEIGIKNVSHTPNNPTLEDGVVKVFFELENDTNIDVYEGYSVGTVNVQYGVYGQNFHGSKPVNVVEHEENKFYANLTYDDFAINVEGLPLLYKIFAESSDGKIGYSSTYKIVIK